MPDSYVHLPYQPDPTCPEVGIARGGHEGLLVARIQDGRTTVDTLNQQDLRGYTVLHEMAQRQRSVKTMLTVVLATGMATDARDNLGQTALHHAAYHDSTTVMKALLAAGADPNLRNDQGNTPFQVAFRNGREKVARLLIAAGANLSSRNRDGLQALDYEPPQGGSWRQELREEIRRAIIEQEKAELLAVANAESATPTARAGNDPAITDDRPSSRRAPRPRL